MTEQEEKRWLVNRARRSRKRLRNAERCAARRARKLQATPAWADPAGIQRVYELAHQLTTLTGIEHHVDHLVPLKSEIVCGLHVRANLVVIQAKANCSKGNRQWPDMP